MPRVVFYIEGNTVKGAAGGLREAFRVFLLDLFQSVESEGWKISIDMCGSRWDAWKRFSERAKDPKKPDAAILLVDAEQPVAVGNDTPISERAKRHLQSLEQGWNVQLEDHQSMHLMTQTMEAWLVADQEALADFYGTGFRANALLGCGVPESVSKPNLEVKLKEATSNSRKGTYHKGRHSAELLKRVNPGIVRAKCPHCENLFTVVPAYILSI